MLFSCEICFPDNDSAWRAMAELADAGIEAAIFDGVVDPYSPAVFVGAYRDYDDGFEKAVVEIADRHGALADSFGVSDHVPVPSDFGFVTAPGHAAREPLAIELVTTANDANGPCPPAGNDWVVVGGTDGRTTWRRISLRNRQAVAGCTGFHHGGTNLKRK